MSDELREYAQRIVDCVSRSEDGFGRTYQRDTEKQGFGLLEPYELAVARLAEHRADSDTPIDEAWLRSVGAIKDDHPQKFTFPREDDLPVGLWHVDDGWKAMLVYVGEGASQLVRGLKTRGDLRRLCEALGIKLEEQGQ